MALMDNSSTSGAADTDDEAKAAFLLRLRTRGIRNLDILRALERVPRDLFVPHLYVDLTRRDLAIPIGCGQTLSEPFLIARMIEALTPTREHRVLEIGTGTGYATAVLTEVAGYVVSVERFQTLAIAARLRLDKLGKTNVDIVWGDGLALPADFGTFDRILVHGRVDGTPAPLLAMLGEQGQMVLARQAAEGAATQRIARVSRGGATDGLAEETLGHCRLQSLVLGTAASL